MRSEEIKNNVSCNFNLAFNFANKKHKNQKITGSDLPYISHISSVCFELLQMKNLSKYDIDFLLTVASLHDTIEDTETSEEEILNNFGSKVLSAVKALSKDYSLPKEIQIIDSLERILLEPKEVQLVKIADRISNLNPPPLTWSKEKIKAYYHTSELLYDKLKNVDNNLSKKLQIKIKEYKQYF